MRIKYLALAAAAASLLAACGGGGEPSGDMPEAGEPTETSSSTPVEGRTAQLMDSEATGARTESFESGAIVRCAYAVEDARLVFEQDTLNVLEGEFSLRRGGDADCAGDDERFERVAGMSMDDVLPPDVSIRTTGANFIANNMDEKTGDVVLGAEITANGQTSGNELACRGYSQRDQLWISCDLDEVRLENHGLPATEGSSGERLRFTVRGSLTF